ncbi:hypothetical protein [Oscillibacter sp.]|uniref:hypothetical protein n=1 Tax=Oscillibacter sp. TaxID=1945593 RepID=UPI00289B2CBC|nr:hypothetical protein [Oscillibacter sp.]
MIHDDGTLFCTAGLPLRMQNTAVKCSSVDSISQFPEKENTKLRNIAQFSVKCCLYNRRAALQKNTADSKAVRRKSHFPM